MSDDKNNQIASLRSLIENNNSQIARLSDSINTMERAHDSLVQFRRSVVSTQESVRSITSNQSQYLSSVKGMSRVSKSADGYGNGMSKTLSGYGTKVVVLALSGLLLKIDLKLMAYKASISSASHSISQLQSQSSQHSSAITQLENQIREEQEAKK